MCNNIEALIIVFPFSLPLNGVFAYKRKVTMEMILTMQIKTPSFKVRGPFVQTLCIEKDSYMDAI